MARLRSLAAVLLVILAGCSDQSTPVSPSNAQVTPSAASLLSGDVTLVVVATEETWLPDGTLSYRFITTTSYDRHGNPVEIDVREDEFPGLHYVSVFNRHGNLVHQVFDFYYQYTNDIWIRHTTSTTEYDRKGNPTEQLLTNDFSGDGTVEVQYPAFITYDQRHNAIKTEFGNPNGADGINYSETRTYDAHGNVLHFAYEKMMADGTADLQIATSSTYSHHDALVSYVTERTPLESATPDTRESMSTIAYDRRGNPVLQKIELTVVGGESSEAAIIIGPYDQHRNPARKVIVGDGMNDGTIYPYITITYEYIGQGHAPNASTRSHDRGAAAASRALPSLPFGPGTTGGDNTRMSPGLD